MARSRTRALPAAVAVATYKSLIEKHKGSANRFPTDWMMLLEDQIAAYDRLLRQSDRGPPLEMATIKLVHERAQLCHNFMKWLHDKQNAIVAASQRYEDAREQYLYVVESLLLLVQAGRLDRGVKLELGTVEENMGRLCLEWGERTNDSARVREAARWFRNAEDTYGMLGADGSSRADRVRGKQREQSQVLVRLTSP